MVSLSPEEEEGKHLSSKDYEDNKHSEDDHFASANSKALQLQSECTHRGSMDSEGAFEVQIGASASDVELMPPIDKEARLALEFGSISGWVPNLKLGAEGGTLAVLGFKRCWGGSQEKEGGSMPTLRQILYDVTGRCMPGELLALMGPSGSGKTTLLSILGGRKPSALKLEGVPLYNGEKLTKRAKRQVGFVLQDDLLYQQLTVHEVLYFAAMLRLPSTMTKEAKMARVDTVITALGLDRCRDTIVGGFFRRGISGGERKRVSVGHELLINPSILLLDEPTSGLDSTTAMHLVTSLRQLAFGGRAIVTTIHQPSSRLYQQLDKLLLLSEGHCMYYGRASLAADWFHRLGFSMPFGVNTADFILDLASGDVSTRKLKGQESRLHLIACAEQYARSHRDQDGYQMGQTLEEADIGQDLWSAAQSRKRFSSFIEERDYSSSAKDGETSPSGPDNEVPVGVMALSKGSRWGAPYWAQITFLFQRSLKVRRFETMQFLDFLQFVSIGLLCGAFWWQAGQTSTTAGAQNVIGLLFFESLFLSFRSMFQALFTFPNEYKMMLKERASGMYRLSAFYFARTASDLPLEFTVPSLFVFLAYWMGGLQRTAAAFFSNWLTVALVTMVAQGFGLLMGATVMNPKTGQTLITVFMLGMMLVGGFYVQQVPVWIRWVRYASFIFYGYSLALKVEFSGRTFYNCGNQIKPHNFDDCTVIPPGGLQKALNLSTEEWPWEALVLLGMMVFFRVLVYVALRVKTNKA